MASRAGVGDAGGVSPAGGHGDQNLCRERRLGGSVGSVELLAPRRAVVANVWDSLSELLLHTELDHLTGAMREAAEELDAEDAERAAEVARRGAQLAEAAGFEAVPSSARGRPKAWPTLLDLAERHGASAIVVLAATLSAVPVIPAIGLVLVLSVDWFMGMARALGNLIGNCVATVAIASWEGDIDRERARAVLDGTHSPEDEPLAEPGSPVAAAHGHAVVAGAAQGVH